MSSSLKNAVSGSIWGILSKVLDALAKFVTIPLLIGLYGKSDYGLIALAFSLNAYLRLMDLGMNIGSIRFFSIWFEQKEFVKIKEVSQSSIVFYGIIGIINSLIFIFIGYVSDRFYKFEDGQYEVFRAMMFILAASTVPNWISYVVTQLLSAKVYISWLNKVTIISSVLNLLSAYIALKLELSLPAYFLLYTISTVSIIPFNIWKLRELEIPVLELIKPKWSYSAFKEVLSYSVGIFLINIFQFSTDNLRPLLLASFATAGISVLTDFRIIQTMALLVGSFGATFTQVLLPLTSQSIARNDSEKSNMLAYTGTKYISIFLSFIVFIISVNIGDILELYVGRSYLHLTPWVILWLMSIYLSMHYSSISSMIYSTGHTKPLLYISILGCVITLSLTVLLAPTYNVGAPLIGYAIYVVVHTFFVYVYYIPVILRLNNLKLFVGSFVPSLICGIASSLISYGLGSILKFNGNLILNILINSTSFAVTFCLICFTLIIRRSEVKALRLKMIK